MHAESRNLYMLLELTIDNQRICAMMFRKTESIVSLKLDKLFGFFVDNIQRYHLFVRYQSVNQF